MIFATSSGEKAEIGALYAEEGRLSYSAAVDVPDLALQLVFGQETPVRELDHTPLEETATPLASQPGPRILKVGLHSNGAR
jgi:hypothetical protein